MRSRGIASRFSAAIQRPPLLPHHHVGDHVAHVARAESAPGLRIEREDQRADVAQLVLGDAQQAPQAVEVARGEHVEVLGDERDRGVAMRRRLGQRAQLQLEAFGHVARAHARGLEVVHVAQRDLQVLDLDVGHVRGERRLAQLLELLLEVAVLVEVADDHRGDALVALGEAGERELLQQVILQRGLGCRELREVVALVVVAPRAAGGAVLVAEAVVLGEVGRLLAPLFAIFLATIFARARVLAFGLRAVDRGGAGSSGGPRSARSSSGFSAR